MTWTAFIVLVRVAWKVFDKKVALEDWIILSALVCASSQVEILANSCSRCPFAQTPWLLSVGVHALPRFLGLCLQLHTMGLENMVTASRTAISSKP